MSELKVCWEDRCTNLRDIALCARCRCPFCPEHMAELGLCMHCIPVDEYEYQKWAKKYQREEKISDQ